MALVVFWLVVAAWYIIDGFWIESEDDPRPSEKVRRAWRRYGNRKR